MPLFWWRQEVAEWETRSQFRAIRLAHLIILELFHRADLYRHNIYILLGLVWLPIAPIIKANPTFRWTATARKPPSSSWQISSAKDASVISCEPFFHSDMCYLFRNILDRWHKVFQRPSLNSDIDFKGYCTHWNRGTLSDTFAYWGVGWETDERNTLRRRWLASEKTTGQGRGTQIQEFWERGKVPLAYTSSHDNREIAAVCDQYSLSTISSHSFPCRLASFVRGEWHYAR